MQTATRTEHLSSIAVDRIAMIRAYDNTGLADRFQGRFEVEGFMHQYGYLAMEWDGKLWTSCHPTWRWKRVEVVLK